LTGIPPVLPIEGLEPPPSTTYAEHLVVEAIERPAAGAAVVTVLAVLLDTDDGGATGDRPGRTPRRPHRRGRGRPRPGGAPWHVPGPELSVRTPGDAEVTDPRSSTAVDALHLAGFEGAELLTLEVGDGWPWVARFRQPDGQHRPRCGSAATSTGSSSPVSRSDRAGRRRTAPPWRRRSGPRDRRRGRWRRDPPARTPARGTTPAGHPPDPLPDPGRLASLLVRTWLEVRAGRRSLDQLAPLVTPAVLRRLAPQVTVGCDAAPPVNVRTVRVDAPSPLAREASVMVRDTTGRTTAVAVRLERNLGRWRVTELMAPEAGLPPLTTASFPDGYRRRDAFDEADDEPE
jgi:hypothetical protein